MSGKEDKKPFNNPFGKLSPLRESLVPTKRQLREEDFPSAPPAGPSRAVLSLSRRGEKTVTVISELGLSAEALESWRMALQRGLAVAVSIEGDFLVCEGDQRFGLPDLLLRKGIGRIEQRRAP